MHTQKGCNCAACDAERYRWLNRQHNFLITINEKPVRLRCGGAVLDDWIDARIAEEQPSAASDGSK